MATQTTQTDMGIGVAMLFSVLALVGAAVMLVGPDQLTQAWGFAGAMVAASLAVVAVHVYAN
ncbi:MULTISPECIES: DUF7525 family protein [Haloprofundus]|uniref:DUF7525 family protein n=1 Tax=Haloprofundus TaxID=1911573 RepID=UPI000E4366A4|nr:MULTISPECIES: hypothetical protein [Haloprofundus]QCJ48136.1 hypothetical protein FCF25_13825 [Haloprofundus sp. MHR1]